jgi:hypothetical protein
MAFNQLDIPLNRRYRDEKDDKKVLVLLHVYNSFIEISAQSDDIQADKKNIDMIDDSIH